MTRAAALTAVSALCLIWTAGCGSTDTPRPDAASTAGKSADAAPDPHGDLATLAKNLPSTLDGEIHRAQLLRAKGDYDEAARSFAQLMLVEPDDGRVVGEYGKVLEQQGHSRDALPFLKRAAQLSPNDWSVHSALGVAYDQVDDHVSARASYERALALKPGEGSVLNNYAVSRMLAGDYAGAKRLFAQAEANGTSNPKIAGNLEKLAALAPQPAAKPVLPPAAPQQATQLHVQASALPPPAKANPVVATVPPAAHVSIPAKTNPVTTAATQAPHTSATPTMKGGAAIVRVAGSTPKALGGQVVMQRVPHDPLAGPVHHAPLKLASRARKTHPAAKSAAKKPQAVTPSLRTAADTN